jgi:hypothetical protein
MEFEKQNLLKIYLVTSDEDILKNFECIDLLKNLELDEIFEELLQDGMVTEEELEKAEFEVIKLKKPKKIKNELKEPYIKLANFGDPSYPNEFLILPEKNKQLDKNSYLIGTLLLQY